MHHIISDGWSMGILVKELLAFYNAFAKVEKKSLPPLRIQYKDYAAWQQGLLGSAEMEQTRAYWLSKLSGEPAVQSLPTDFPPPLVKSYNGSTVSFFMEKQDTEALKNLGRENGMTLYMTLVGIIKILLFKYTAQQDSIIGAPIAGRSHIDLEGQIGFYVNTLALRDRIRDSDSFSSVFSKVKQTVLEAHEHQVYPFDQLVEDLEVKRELNRNPLFEIMVVLQDGDMIEDETTVNDGTLKIRKMETDYRTSLFDINFNMKETSSGLHILLEYNTDLYERTSMLLLRDRFLQLIRMCIQDVNQTINEIQFDGIQLEEKILENWEINF
jgi:hypothetical protein